jgi:hypothetical protein
LAGRIVPLGAEKELIRKAATWHSAACTMTM